MKSILLKKAVIAILCLVSVLSCNKGGETVDERDTKTFVGTWQRYDASTMGGGNTLVDTANFNIYAKCNFFYGRYGTYYLKKGYLYCIRNINNADTMKLKYTIVNNDSIRLEPEVSSDQEYRLKRIK
jgi:hypothetical protein